MCDRPRSEPAWLSKGELAVRVASSIQAALLAGLISIDSNDYDTTERDDHPDIEEQREHSP
jgi:hypothetical protein